MTQQPPYGSGHDPRYGSPFGPPPGATSAEAGIRQPASFGTAGQCA